MESSILIARIIGPYCVIVSLGALMNFKAYLRIFDEFSGNSALIFIRGALALICGLTVLQYHSSLAFTWDIIITLLGWGAVVKGVYLVLFPSLVSRAMEFYKKYPIFMVFLLSSALMLGILLSIFGYFIDFEPLILK